MELAPAPSISRAISGEPRAAFVMPVTAMMIMTDQLMVMMMKTITSMLALMMTVIPVMTVQMAAMA